MADAKILIVKTLIVMAEMLSQIDAERLMTKYGIPTPRAAVAKDAEEAAAAAEKIGWPVVLKILSPDIVHKSEAGAIALDIKSAEELRSAASRILSSVRKSRPDARIDGFLVQETLRGHELIVGAARDEQFGPVVLLGSGGIFVEIVKDVTFRVAPITRKDAWEMIKELKAYAALSGARGQKAADFSALEGVLLSVSSLIMNENVLELDINPLFVSDRCVAGDVRVMVSEELKEKTAPILKV